MKFITLIFFFFITQAYAQTCTPEIKKIFLNDEYTSEAYIIRTSKDHGKFSSLEKKMIVSMITDDAYYADASEAQALEIFADISEWSRGKPGFNAGEIVYHKINNKILAQVHHYPGDNQYGAIYEVKGLNFTKLAEINDGDINCL